MNHIVGLDIGSHAIRAAVAQVGRGGNLSLVSLLSAPSAGLRRGAVEQPAAATQALSSVIAGIKTISRSAVKNIIVSVASPDLKVQFSRGVVAVSRADDEIYQDDISRVIQSAKAINLPANRTVVEWVIKEFLVDGISNIQDPLGMIGKRLEVTMLLVDTFTPSIKNMERCVQTLGGDVAGMVVGPLAAADAVLTQEQRELGVMVVDIGFGKTSLAIFEENRLAHVAVIPVGSASITNDLAIGLRIPISVAETIKLTYGSALAKEVSARDAIELAKIDPRAKGTVTKKFVAEIIEDRLAEIFELVNNEVKRVGKASQLPAGVTIVGGGAKLPNVAELARQELKLSAQIGVPDVTSLASSQQELNLQAEDPEFATAIGLLRHHRIGAGKETIVPRQLTGTFKKLLNYFIP